MSDLRKALEEKARRLSRFTVEQFCFPEQIKFIRDKSRFKTAVCGRRSGKTTACAAHLIENSLANPNRTSIYITLSRAQAKRIIWKDLLKLNEKFFLTAKVNESDLSMTFPNGSIIYLSGASDQSEIEKFRGLPISLCYLDEAQSFKSYIQSLIDEVISKALFDYNGTLCLIGTPGPVPSGYFYECAHSENWSHHSWTMFENPFIKITSGKDPRELLQEDLNRTGFEINHPTIQREVFAKWMIDPNALVFKYNSEINHYDNLPKIESPWSYVIGVDLGHDDADAISVIGWNDNIKEAYLVEEFVRAKQGITELAEKIQSLVTKYDPLKVVMDTGGLGKKIAEEIQKRYTLAISPAEKARKLEFIELLNDAMRTKKFFAKKNSRFAQDCQLVEWDRDSDILKISDKFHSDIADSTLYAYRESLHWLYEPPKPKAPEYQTDGWFKKQEKEMIEIMNKTTEDESVDIWGDVDF